MNNGQIKNNGNYFQLHPHRHTGSCLTDETETSGDYVLFSFGPCTVSDYHLKLQPCHTMFSFAIF